MINKNISSSDHLTRFVEKEKEMEELSIFGSLNEPNQFWQVLLSTSLTQNKQNGSTL